MKGRPVCDHGWDFADGYVICRQLGFGPAINTTTGSKLLMMGMLPADTYGLDLLKTPSQVVNQQTVRGCTYYQDHHR